MVGDHPEDNGFVLSSDRAPRRMAWRIPAGRQGRPFGGTILSKITRLL